MAYKGNWATGDLIDATAFQELVNSAVYSFADLSTIMDFDVHIDRISHSVNAINQTWTWSLRTSSGSEVGAWILGSSRLGESTNLAW